MHSRLQSLICVFAHSRIPDGMQHDFDDNENSIQHKGGISEVEITDGRDTVSYGDDRGDAQTGFCIEDNSESQNEKPRDVKQNP